MWCFCFIAHDQICQPWTIWVLHDMVLSYMKMEHFFFVVYRFCCIYPFWQQIYIIKTSLLSSPFKVIHKSNYPNPLYTQFPILRNISYLLFLLRAWYILFGQNIHSYILFIKQVSQNVIITLLWILHLTLNWIILVRFRKKKTSLSS